MKRRMLAGGMAVVLSLMVMVSPALAVENTPADGTDKEVIEEPLTSETTPPEGETETGEETPVTPPDQVGEVPSPIRSARYRTAHGKTVRCTGHLAAKLLAVRCPEDVRMAVQTGLPIPAAALRAYRAKKRITVRRSSVINEGGPASLRDAGKL